MADVAVVGGGVGGVAAALRLRAAGHDVVLFERNPVLGGKLAGRSFDGFTFDTGPSLLTLPEVFDDLLATAGTSLAEVVAPVRLDPICRYRWPDGSGFDHRADRAEATAAVERLIPGQGAAFAAYLEHGQRVWEVSQRTFFAGPMESPADLIRRMRGPADLWAIDPLRTLDARARSHFDDPRLVQWAGRYATYSGSSPYAAPATLACIPWIEQSSGAWYVPGGLARLAQALGGVLAGAGVEVRTETDVEAIRADTDAVQGVRLAGGESVDADVVVANVDATHLYADLLPDRQALRRVLRAPVSSSGFALLAAVEGRTEGLAHHNIAFSADARAEFSDIFDRHEAPGDPTLYVCASAVSDPSQAPDGCENWFVLVNVPPAGAVDWDGEAEPYRDHLLEVLARRGWDLAGRLRSVETITPADIARRYRSWQGAIYGTSSNGRRAAFLRPANRGPRRGLYLVGGSSHPGGGLPLVTLSGAIVAAMVEADLQSLRRNRPD
ncbi:MAG: phytoene desaturase family protein [Actinomycetota bacterium]|nr:phytoene desaturase family protein [Actinomycetota bacterium]